MSTIHQTALISHQAELDTDVEIGPYSVIAAGVKIGKRTRVASHVVIEGRTSIGQGNTIYQFATIGSRPQDLKYRGEASELIIGNHNTIREYVSLNPGTAGGGMVTVIDCAYPCDGAGSVCTPPLLPMLLPPYTAASLLSNSR